MLTNHLSCIDSNNSTASLQSTVLDPTISTMSFATHFHFTILPCPNYSLWLVVMIILHTGFSSLVSFSSLCLPQGL